jgi:hypothetical protein
LNWGAWDRDEKAGGGQNRASANIEITGFILERQGQSLLALSVCFSGILVLFLGS